MSNDMIRALAYGGKNRLKTAYLMFRATYSYSMSSGVCTRFESLVAATENFFLYLVKPRKY